MKLTKKELISFSNRVLENCKDEIEIIEEVEEFMEELAAQKGKRIEINIPVVTYEVGSGGCKIQSA